MSGATFTIAAAILTIALAAQPQVARRDLRVLFIGNSLTSVNDLPARVRRIGEADGSTIVTSMLAQLAASDVGARLLPAGDAWRAAWTLDPAAALYGPDGFHASVDGTWLARWSSMPA